MVEIYTYIGDTKCKGCNKPLILSSDDNYKGCVNCRYPAELTYQEVTTPVNRYLLIAGIVILITFSALVYFLT